MRPELAEVVAALGDMPPGAIFTEMPREELPPKGFGMYPPWGYTVLRARLSADGWGDQLQVLVPLALESLETVAGPEVGRRILEAAQLSCAFFGLEWPSDWPSAGVALKCPDCDLVRCFSSLEAGERLLAQHRAIKHPDHAPSTIALPSPPELSGG